MKLNHEHIVIICSGTNDLAINKTTLAFQSISNMMTKNNHTNIILVNMPCMYDTANINMLKMALKNSIKGQRNLLKYLPMLVF